MGRELMGVCVVTPVLPPEDPDMQACHWQKWARRQHITDRQRLWYTSHCKAISYGVAIM